MSFITYSHPNKKHFFSSIHYYYFLFFYLLEKKFNKFQYSQQSWDAELARLSRRWALQCHLQRKDECRDVGKYICT